MQRPRSALQVPCVGKIHWIGILRCAAITFVATACVAGAAAQSPASGVGSVSGTVFYDGGSRPAGQVTVSLRSNSQRIVRRVLTDYEGHFRVADLPDGAYEVVVEEPGCESERVNTTVDGSGASVSVHLKPYNAAAIVGKPNTVSVRELQMPQKARNEYQKGLDGISRNDFAESLRHLTKATQAFPRYYEAFDLIGVAEMKLGEFEKAIEAFQKSIDLSAGRYAAALFGMGYTSYLQGKLKEAETILRRGLEVDANSADGYFYLGMTLFVENRIEDAEKNAREALLRKPDLAPAYIVLADVHARRHEFREQLEALDNYLKLSPNGPSAERVRQVRRVTLGILAGLRPVS